MSGAHRRTVIKGAAVAAAATSVSWARSRPAAATSGARTELRWLEGAPDAHAGATWGVPWARGTRHPEQPLGLTTVDGTDVPVRTWPTAYRPDGSVKRTAHAIAPDAPKADRYLLGTRHYADSAKQVRISATANRRFFHYLTGDERTGDLLRELADVERTFLAVDPQRKVRTDGYLPGDRHAPKAEQARAKLVNSLRTIAAQPHGFFTGTGLLDADTGKFAVTSSTAVNVSHHREGFLHRQRHLLPLRRLLPSHGFPAPSPAHGKGDPLDLHQLLGDRIPT
ncbi:hypothetical protein IAG44_06145 [Streptomyces roseirectus]|uniref:Uncharacterized protein n=1 Tax=Streptomyces roseirectus TaxID=2768066 RepID=A0A7H0I8E7_9ACTN|nr:hypothetical protein [Streptomyces roseirectus]QNP69063.1 hypothetical protein IAG44_06145 [Streptomyces roseirectus]